MAAPLSPAQVRDSARQAQRLSAVLDSLKKDGSIPAATITMARNALSRGAEGMQAMMGGFGGGGGGGFGGGGGAPGVRNDRPGETRPTPSFPTAGQGGGGATLVESGTYRVTLTAGGKTTTQLLRVEKLATAGSSSGFGFEDEEELLRQFNRWLRTQR